MKYLTERRFTCNRVFRHLMFYHLNKFSGRVKVYGNNNDQVWNFYFLYGDLTWAYENTYACQRWQRQFLGATGENPQLEHIDWNTECSDCKELRILTQNNSLVAYQIQRIIRGTLEEILFDVVQAFEAPVYQFVNPSESRKLLSLSSLTGIGDGMELEVEAGVHADPYYRLPYRFFPTLKSLQETVYETWKKWVQLGLSQFSPNEAPLLIKPEVLKSQVSEKNYENLSKVFCGQKSLLNLAFQFKHNRNFLKLATTIAPYVQQGLIEFKFVPEFSSQETITKSYAPLNFPQQNQKKPLLLVVDFDQERQALLKAIAEEKGYNIKVIDQSAEAIYELINKPDLKPDVIFTTHEMSTIKTTEFCSILRRLESLKNTPILIYANLFKLKKQAQDIFRAGATELIDDPLFTHYHLNSLLEMYVGFNTRFIANQNLSNHSKKNNYDLPTITFDSKVHQLPISTSIY